MKVSVIIPIYNAERFLRDTLNDVVSQTLEDIEIICVDDGSTDSSEEIIRSFMERDSRVTLLQQQNLYCGVARNNGYAHASGEYICFWDADDRFAPESLECMYEQARKTDADICVCGVEDFDSETGICMPRTAYLNVKAAGSKQPFNKYDIPEHIFNFTSNHVWNKLFRRAFIEEHQLSFGTGDFSEETMFIQPALYYAERICYVDKVLIRYRVFNSSSAVMNTSARKVKYYKDLYNFYFFMKATGEFETFEVSILSKCLGSFLVDLEANMNFEQFSETYQDMKTRVFEDFGLLEKKEDFFRTKTNYRKMHNILKMEPGDYVLLYKLEQKRELLLRVEKQRAEKKRAQADVKKKQKQIERLEKELAAQRAQREALAVALRKSEEKLRAMHKSYSYRIGKVITFVPGKLKRLIKSLFLSRRKER